MKKSLFKNLLIGTLLVGGLAGCGNNTPSESSKPSTPVQESSKPAESSQAQESSKPAESSQVQESSEAKLEYVVSPAVVEATHIQLNLSNLETGEVASDVTVGGFKFYTNNDQVEGGSTKKTMTVSDLDTPIAKEEGSTEGYKKVLKTQSASSVASGKVARVIEFKTTGKGTIKVWGKSGNADEERAIGVYSADKQIEHSSAKLGAEMSCVELTFHYAGTYYLTSAANVSLYELSASWTDGVNEVWPEETGLVFSDPKVLNGSEVTKKTYTETVSGGIFSINASSSGSVVVESNSKSYDGVSYSVRMKSGGAGYLEYRSFGVDLSAMAEGKEARVTIVCMSSSSSADRQANLFDISSDDKITEVAIDETKKAHKGTPVGEDITVGGASLSGYTFVVTKGKYYFASNDGGINVYAIIVEYLD